MRMTKRLLREGQLATLDSLLELSAGCQAIAHKTADHREAVTRLHRKARAALSSDAWAGR
ncbi:enoyl-CoA hydratase [Alicycliphilus sp. B1]|nr:enoyl-CoA hydratase [Alicycliphilus sp. B1]